MDWIHWKFDDDTSLVFCLLEVGGVMKRTTGKALILLNLACWVIVLSLVYLQHSTSLTSTSLTGSYSYVSPHKDDSSSPSHDSHNSHSHDSHDSHSHDSHSHDSHSHADAADDGDHSHAGGDHGVGHAHGAEDMHEVRGHGVGSIALVDHIHTMLHEADQVGAPGAKGLLEPGERPELSKEVFSRVAVNNQVVVTFANYQHREFIVSYVRNMVKLDISNYVVGAFDDRLMEYLIARGIYVVRVRTEEAIAEEGLGWGGEEFVKLMRAKYITIGQIIKWGFELLVTDDDMAFLRNPLPWLHQHSRFADILISTDKMATRTYDDGLELPEPGKPEFNCGFVYIRPTQRATVFFDELVKRLREDHSLRDQPAINIMMAEGYEGSRVVPGTRVFHAWHGKVRVGALPTVLFCNGQVYFVQKLPQRLGITPFMAHVTHVFGGDHGKRHRLRETMLFSDDVAYYADGRFLSFDLDLPEKWMRDLSHVKPGDIPKEHIALGKHQVKQFFDAAMIARKTGRILIIPKLWGACERIWYFLNECRAGGGKAFQLPYVAPLDHILNPQHFDDLGIVGFREASFLEDPRVPLSVLNSRLNIYFCDPDAGEPCDEVSNVVDQTVAEEWLSHGATDEEWAEKLNTPEYEAYRLIHISPISNAVTGMADVDFFKGEWQNIVHRVAGVWCCHKDGPIKFLPYE